MTDSPSDHLKQKSERQQRTIELLTDRIRMLEEENHSLVIKLKELGVEVRESSRTSSELPAPLPEPLDRESEDFTRLGEPERRLAEELLDGQSVYLLERSDTGLDVGHWMNKGLVWVAAEADELVLFAAGSRPFQEKIPFSHLYRSLYNHVTGDLVLAPAEGAKLTRIRIAPATAYQFLAQIFRKQND